MMDPQLPESQESREGQVRCQDKEDTWSKSGRGAERTLSRVEQQWKGQGVKRLGHDPRWLARSRPHVARLQLRFQPANADQLQQIRLLLNLNPVQFSILRLDGSSAPHQNRHRHRRQRWVCDAVAVGQPPGLRSDHSKVGWLTGCFRGLPTAITPLPRLQGYRVCLTTPWRG
ncbi:hypothetical protein BDW68DRAFT_41649 [Aspergillus falconensis]